MVANHTAATVPRALSPVSRSFSPISAFFVIDFIAPIAGKPLISWVVGSWGDQGLARVACRGAVLLYLAIDTIDHGDIFRYLSRC